MNTKTGVLATAAEIIDAEARVLAAGDLIDSAARWGWPHTAVGEAYRALGLSRDEMMAAWRRQARRYDDDGVRLRLREDAPA